MRTFANALRAVVLVAVFSGLASVEAAACPQGYFQCGSVCCPSR